MTFDEAKTRLSTEIKLDGSLYSLGWYLYWDAEHSDSACLDGDFAADDLIAIGTYMKAMQNART